MNMEIIVEYDMGAGKRRISKYMIYFHRRTASKELLFRIDRYINKLSSFSSQKG